MDDLTTTKLDDFAFWLENSRKRKLTPRTVYNTFKMLRKAFKDLKRRGVLYENPFELVQAGQENGEPTEFIERSTVLKSIECCNHPEIRLAVVFARFAGLRIPCEIENLKWSDFKRLTFHVDGKTGPREVPFFDKIREELKTYAKTGEYLFPEVRKRCDSWVSGKYITVLRRAKIKRWEKLMNSLRASCITDYAQEGVHEKTLNAMFGNSSRIRYKYYIKVRKIEYDRVLSMRFESDGTESDEPSEEFLKVLLPLMSYEEALRLWREAKG